MSAPAPPTRAELNARMKEIDDNWTAKNLDAIFEKYDDNFRYTDLGLGLINLDKPTLRTLMERMFQCVDDFKVEHHSLNCTALDGEAKLFSEFILRGKYSKDIPEFGRPATGKEFVCIGGTFTSLAPGSDKLLKMTHYTKYYFDGDAPEYQGLGGA